ncbi:flagellar calcium-binding protein [Nitzschia inconspicua]|uniref:Flagellar calcium-binding protein n=1 Tax=Nitzschia inconspicua TaxID=303405 RepID=A0A9K3LCX7_9STRA|nr:flagellar calcium-binding protein [Nitzschia inconspicua]
MKLSSATLSIFLLLPLFSAILAIVVAQEYDYDDYPQQDYGAGQDYYGADAGGYYQEEDTLYQDYARHQEEKAMGAGNNGLLKSVVIGVVSWGLGGKFHSRRAVKKVEKKQLASQKELYKRYLQDVSTLQMQNAQLQDYIQQSTVQQLTEEFLQADLNNDRRVSRAEFERYKAQYLEKHPEADAAMFPKFEDFDPDHNGMVTLEEHEAYYRNHGMLS